MCRDQVHGGRRCPRCDPGAQRQTYARRTVGRMTESRLTRASRSRSAEVRAEAGRRLDARRLVAILEARRAVAMGDPMDPAAVRTELPSLHEFREPADPEATWRTPWSPIRGLEDNQILEERGAIAHALHQLHLPPADPERDHQLLVEIATHEGRLRTLTEDADAITEGDMKVVLNREAGARAEHHGAWLESSMRAETSAWRDLTRALCSGQVRDAEELDVLVRMRNDHARAIDHLRALTQGCAPWEAPDVPSRESLWARIDDLDARLATGNLTDTERAALEGTRLALLSDVGRAA